MHELPDAETLARGLTAVLAGPDVRDSVRIESRTVNPYTSSTASDLVTCDLRGVGRFELFCNFEHECREAKRIAERYFDAATVLTDPLTALRL